MSSVTLSQQAGQSVGAASKADRPPQRTLVVVPGSHLENDRVRTRLEEMNLEKERGQRASVPNRHGVRITEIWDEQSQQVRDYRARAVQLDLRSACPRGSCMVLWNSLTIHQGSSTIGPDIQVLDGAFVPPLYTPPTFASDDAVGWHTFLDREGYVVLRDVLESPVESVLESLLHDINRINPVAKLESLNDVSETHLGIHRRGLRYTLGFPHGDFAWKVRLDRRMQQIWKDLFGVEEVMGSTDVPALTRHETAMTVANSETHDEWLHWDHNPLLPPFDQPMYQSMVYLFPEATGRFGGNTWPRIAMVVCMVPTAYGRDSLSEKTLLALAITGEASNHWPQIGRANYGWAGVRLDEMEATGIKLSPEEIDRRLISTEQLQAHHWQRLFPDLNPDLTHEEIQEFLSHLGIGAEHSTRQDNNHKRVALQSADYKLLRDGLDLPVLRHIVHPGLKTYVRFIAAND